MKQTALDNLDKTCQGITQEHGTVYTQMVSYDPMIVKQISLCEKVGCTRIEIKAILDKYTF